MKELLSTLTETRTAHRSIVAGRQLSPMSQDASDLAVVSQETKLLAGGGDIFENSAENSKAPVPSAPKRDADSGSDDSGNSASPVLDALTAAAVENGKRKIAMTSSKR